MVVHIGKYEIHHKIVKRKEETNHIANIVLFFFREKK